MVAMFIAKNNHLLISKLNCSDGKIRLISHKEISKLIDVLAF